MITLEIYVDSACAICQKSKGLGEYARQRCRDLDVRVIDLSEAGAERPESIVATPTFVLNGRVLSLGNPAWAELRAAIEDLRGGQGR